MGNLARKLFRPARGQVLSTYTAAVADGTMYPGDWVTLSTTVPTAQGVSGVIAGQTLGTTDYLECTLAVSTNLGIGSLILGVLMGKSIGSVPSWTDVTAQVVVDQDFVTIQDYGIHPNARQTAAGVLGDYLTSSATAGLADNVTTGTVTNALGTWGVVLAATATYKRITAADQSGGIVFITCNG